MSAEPSAIEGHGKRAAEADASAGARASASPGAEAGRSAGAEARGPRDPGRRQTRLHTARGRMSLSGWLRLPVAWARHRLGSVPERPWVVPAAIGWLRRRIRPDWRVLELGSGRSTAWLARHAGSVLSFEDNEFWAERTRERLAAAGLAAAELRWMPVDRFAEAAAAEPDSAFDLVVVDFLETAGADRVEAVAAARDKVRPGGYLLLDDSDRPGYAPAWELLAGWRERRFSGVKDEWFAACETTIFRRPR